MVQKASVNTSASVGNVLFAVSWLYVVHAPLPAPPQHSCPQEFNDFLRSLKEEVIGTRYSPFWGLVTARPLTLITAAECPASSVAEGEAKELLSGASHVTPQGAESVVEQQEDADDLVRPTAGSAPQCV